MILQEIKSIVDLKEFHQLIIFVDQLRKIEKENTFILECYNLRLQFETANEKSLESFKKTKFFQSLLKNAQKNNQEEMANNLAQIFVLGLSSYLNLYDQSKIKNLFLLNFACIWFLYNFSIINGTDIIMVGRILPSAGKRLAA
jgi:hypothetical protein